MRHADRILRMGFLALVWCAPGMLAGDDNRCAQMKFGPFSDWSAPVNLGPTVNSDSNDQHPAISADGLSLYISSDRPGGYGDFDLYVSHRASADDPWDQPQNLGAVVNSLANESVPTF